MIPNVSLAELKLMYSTELWPRKRIWLNVQVKMKRNKNEAKAISNSRFLIIHEEIISA